MRKTSLSLALFALVAGAGSPPSSGATWQSASLGTASISVDRMAPDMRAAYLRSIRTELQAHGYGTADSGTAGRKELAAAIRRYQRDAGLAVDGVAIKELLDHLMFALPKTYAGRRPHRRVSIPNRTARRIGPIAPRVRSNGGLMPGFKGLPREPVVARELAAPSKPNARPAQRSGVVTQMQQRLASIGYYQGKIDGVFGDELAAAIRTYQKDQNLPVSGVIDGSLLNALLPPATALE